MFNKITATVLGEPFDYAGKGADFWRIDLNAEDIYGEIDRTLGAVSNLTQTCRKGIGVVVAELERRGYGGSSDMDHFRQWYQQTEPCQTHSELSHLVNRTLSEFRKKAMRSPMELMSKTDGQTEENLANLAHQMKMRGKKG